MFQITPVIKNIIIINVIFFIGQMLLPHVNFWLYPTLTDNFEPYQVIVNVFSHANLNHLFFNMLALFFLGTMLESQIDSKSFGAIYLLSAFGGLIVNEALNYLNAFYLGGSLSIVIGASGAVSGVVGALAAYAPNHSIRLLFPPIPVKIKWLALFYLLIDIRGGVSGGNAALSESGDHGVAHWVHIGGMATGFLLMKFWYLRKR